MNFDNVPFPASHATLGLRGYTPHPSVPDWALRSCTPRSFKLGEGWSLDRSRTNNDRTVRRAQMERLTRRQDFSSRVAALLSVFRAEMAMPTADAQDCSDTGESLRQSPAPSQMDSASNGPACNEERSGMGKGPKEVQETGSADSAMRPSLARLVSQVIKCPNNNAEPTQRNR